MRLLRTHRRARQPHSNIRVEFKLLRIEELRELIASANMQMSDYHNRALSAIAEAQELRKNAPNAYYGYRVAQAEALEAQAQKHQEQTRGLQDQILGYHEAIQAIMAGLDDEALRLLSGQ